MLFHQRNKKPAAARTRGLGVDESVFLT